MSSKLLTLGLRGRIIAADLRLEQRQPSQHIARVGGHMQRNHDNRRSIRRRFFRHDRVLPVGFGIALALVAQGLVSAAAPIPLRAGPMTLLFDQDNVFVRYIRVGGHEVIRGINAPIRDHHWATVAPRVSNLHVNDRGDSFEVTFDVTCQSGDVDFRWHGKLLGTMEGVVEFHFDGTAHSTFRKNRIGFCVLHGPSAAGSPWILETSDGESVRGAFPTFVSPHQPAKNLRAITHDVAPGISARVSFEGDVFEMEDQRNWTDASFKTYCTPLALPYPVEVKKGTTISQRVTIAIHGVEADSVEAEDDRPILTVTNHRHVLPPLGLQVSSESLELTDEHVERLRALHLDHLRVDLELSKPSFVADLRRASEQANAIDASLHVGLFLGESPDIAGFQRAVAALKPRVSYWLVTGGDPADFRKAYEFLMPFSGAARIGVARLTDFVTLNRSRPSDANVQAIGFAMNPQVHAFDRASIIETLPIHADVARSAREFAGNRPLIAGPITLAPQLVRGVDPPGGPSPGALPSFVDPRQIEPFAAVWTLGSIKYLADAGVASATYHETVGWAGVMDTNDTESRPQQFPSRPGEVFPVYHLLRLIGDFAGGDVYQVDTSDELKAVGLLLSKNGRRRTLIANLTDRSQAIEVRGVGARSVTDNQAAAPVPESAIQVTVDAYSYVRLDHGSRDDGSDKAPHDPR